MGRDMKNYFVGPMPPRDFLDDFFPVAKLKRNPNITEWTTGVWEESISKKAEIESYDSFVEVAAPFCPSLRVVNSSAQEDSSNRTKFCFAPKPDYCVYLNDVSDTVKTDLSQVEIVGEAKWDSADDPFVHPPVMENGKKTFWNSNSEQIAFDTAGQITSYAAAQLGTQYRTCVYSFFIVKNKARLIRWDRSGAIVTEPFEYNKQPHLAEFFRRYSEASPELRGVDTTVKQPTEEEVAAARPFLEEHLGPDRPLLNVSIATEGDQARHFIVGVPTAAPYAPPGRATRGGVAYDIEGKQLVYLKDAWRLDVEGTEREGDIYALLERNKVSHTARCLVSGDVLDHVTDSDRYAKEPWACQTGTLHPHRHYRLVLGTVGRSLTKFNSTYEMVQAVRDAMQAHWEAYVAGILHRDISVGNILIVNGRGLLIDWDFSEIVSKAADCPRPTLRTGTWQFMSAALIEDTTKQHTVVDDLESSLYVILFAAALYAESSLNSHRLRQLVIDVFDAEQTPDGSAYTTRSRWLRGNTMAFEIEFPKIPVLSSLIRHLAVSFAGRYASLPRSNGSTASAWEPPLAPTNDMTATPAYERAFRDFISRITQPSLDSHKELLWHLDVALEDRSWWPDNDAAASQKIARTWQETDDASGKDLKTGMKHSRSDRDEDNDRANGIEIDEDQRSNVDWRCPLVVHGTRLSFH